MSEIRYELENWQSIKKRHSSKKFNFTGQVRPIILPVQAGIPAHLGQSGSFFFMQGWFLLLIKASIILVLGSSWACLPSASPTQHRPSICCSQLTAPYFSFSFSLPHPPLPPSFFSSSSCLFLPFLPTCLPLSPSKMVLWTCWHTVCQNVGMDQAYGRSTRTGLVLKFHWLNHSTSIL